MVCGFRHVIEAGSAHLWPCRRRAIALLAVLVLIGACGAGTEAGVRTQGTDRATAEDDPAGQPALGGELLVFAATSLTNAFDGIAAAFEQRHPGVTVTLNLAGSQQLAGQLLEGAPADVFASANGVQMDRVAEAGLLAAEPVTFVRNTLAIAVAAGNPLGIASLADLDNPRVTLVLAAEEVPAGRSSRQALDAAGVTVRPASLELDVRSVLSKVELGEADAGIVYASDLATADDRVESVAIPPGQNVDVAYPVAALARASAPDVASAFVAFLQDETAQQLLADAGFERP